jgi:HEAT repeat protein
MRKYMLFGLLVGLFSAPLCLLAGEPGADELVRGLHSGDEAQRLRAIDTLAAAGAKIPGAVDALVEQLSNKSAKVRVHAVAALGQMDPPATQAAATIARLMADPNVHVRRVAVRAFRQVRPDPKAAIPLLMKALEDSDPAVKIGVLDMLAEFGKVAVPALVQALGNDKTAYWACLALSEVGPDAEPAVPTLRLLLDKNKNPEIRREAVMSLGAIGPASAPAVPALVAVLDQDDPAMRLSGAYALGQIGPAAKAATGPLREFVDGNQPVFLRTLSVWALARINPDDKEAVGKAVPMLLDALGSREPRLRAMASRALGDLHVDPALLMPTLLKLLDRPRGENVSEVLNVLAGLGEPAVPGLVKALNFKEAQPKAAAMLARIGPAAKAATPALIEVVQTGDPIARHEALLALGAIGPAAKAVVPTAIKALQDSDPNVRYSACYALGKIGPPALAARDALQKQLADNDSFLSLVSAWALARIDPDCSDTAPKSVPLLIQALKEPEPMIRLEAASSLRCLGPRAKSAAPALKKTARNDSSDLVRDMANEAIEAMEGE